MKYDVYYKREALQSLEIANSLNFVTFAGYWIYVFPRTYDLYKASSVDETYGDNVWSLSYFYLRGMLQHTLPLLISLGQTFTTDVIVLETDWLLVVLTSVLYVATNWAVSKYAVEDDVYFLDWSTISRISAYSPLVAGAGFTVVALA